MDQTIVDRLEALSSLLYELRGAKGLKEKIDALSKEKNVEKAFQEFPQLEPLLAEVSDEAIFAFKSVMALGQAAQLFPSGKWNRDAKERLYTLLEQLIRVEKFYQEIGGIVGYHCMVLKFMLASKGEMRKEARSFYPAHGTDISKETEEVRKARFWGIQSLPTMAEIYVLGGSADRLRLYDEATGTPLPAARLRFGGRTLLENLLRDLGAREYLHFKLLRKQIFTPIAMMTSPEKNNQDHIHAICEENDWFGRPKDTFRIICQPLVPTINAQGKWCHMGPFKLLMKPGGHGVIWKLSRDEGIFSWLSNLGRIKALVRQINNPIAGTDYGLLAFAGIGCKHDKAFGFASCEREVKASEGVNILVEKNSTVGMEYGITNIEYCDFTHFGIVDEPKEKGSPYSKYPSNTNILFVDLKSVEEASIENPMPGLLINLKKTAFMLESGHWKEEEIARLESTMQNIADHFLYPDKDDLPTYLTFNERRKTISTTKREFSLGSSLLETPEGCFLDHLKNAYELLHKVCGFELHDVVDAASFFRKGPPFLFFYHPALGPLYEIIGQKIRKGRISYGSELQVDLADLDIEGLDLKGSLLIESDAPMGMKSENGILDFSKPGGRCVLHNVTVRNRGIDLRAHQVYWRNEISRKECCKILLHGSSEFEARNVTLSGNLLIEVEDGFRLIAQQNKGRLEFKKERIQEPSWEWTYTLMPDYRIALSKKLKSAK
jgi:hypothetical protein